MMELSHERSVVTTLRLPVRKHRELRMAVAERGLSIQKALEQAVNLWLYRESHSDARPATGPALRGLLRDTNVLELRKQERRKELRRDARRS